MNKKTIPDNWWTYHHEDCGTKYRDCHPSKCPKNVYEKTGKWIGPKFRRTWIDQLIEYAEYMIQKLEEYREEIRSTDNILLKCPHIESQKVYFQIVFWRGKLNGLEELKKHEQKKQKSGWSKMDTIRKIIGKG